MEPAIPHSAEPTCLKVHSCIFCLPFPQYKNNTYHVCTTLEISGYIYNHTLNWPPHQRSRVGIIVHMYKSSAWSSGNIKGCARLTAGTWSNSSPCFHSRGSASSLLLPDSVAQHSVPFSSHLTLLQMNSFHAANILFLILTAYQCCPFVNMQRMCFRFRHQTYVLCSSFVPLRHTLTIALIILFCNYSLVYLSPPRQGRPLPPLWSMWVPGTRSVCRYLWGSSMPSTQVDIEQVNLRWALTRLSQPWVRGPIGLSV